MQKSFASCIFLKNLFSSDFEGRFLCQCCHLRRWMGRRLVEQRGPDLANHSPAKKLASHWVLLNLYLCYCSVLVFASLKTISLVFVSHCVCICICIWTWPCSLKTIRRPISPGAIQFPSCHCQGLLFTKVLLIAMELGWQTSVFGETTLKFHMQTKMPLVLDVRLKLLTEIKLI